MKKILIIILLFLLPSISNATQITYGTTYSANGQVTNVNLNGNFNNASSVVNGKLDNTNADTTNGYRFYQTVSVLPAPGNQGAVYFLTTDNSLNFDTGSSFGKVSAGMTVPSGGAFFMFSGSCPSGTTDITATYNNKFIKINATQGTSSGVVLTGTTDSHVLATTEIPAHTHDILTSTTAGGATTFVRVGVAAAQGVTQTSGSTGGGLGHTHTISSATTLEPSSVTARLCQVN